MTFLSHQVIFEQTHFSCLVSDDRNSMVLITEEACVNIKEFVFDTEGENFHSE